jgi:hypothetical protein
VALTNQFFSIVTASPYKKSDYEVAICFVSFSAFFCIYLLIKSTFLAWPTEMLILAYGIKYCLIVESWIKQIKIFKSIILFFDNIIQTCRQLDIKYKKKSF